MAVLDSAGRALLELPLKGLDALPQAKLGQYLGDIEGLLSGELSPEALAGLAGKYDEADVRGRSGELPDETLIAGDHRAAKAVRNAYAAAQAHPGQRTEIARDLLQVLIERDSDLDLEELALETALEFLPGKGLYDLGVDAVQMARAIDEGDWSALATLGGVALLDAIGSVPGVGPLAERGLRRLARGVGILKTAGREAAERIATLARVGGKEANALEGAAEKELKKAEGEAGVPEMSVRETESTVPGIADSTLARRETSLLGQMTEQEIKQRLSMIDQDRFFEEVSGRSTSTFQIARFVGEEKWAALGLEEQRSVRGALSNAMGKLNEDVIRPFTNERLAAEGFGALARPTKILFRHGQRVEVSASIDIVAIRRGAEPMPDAVGGEEPLLGVVGDGGAVTFYRAGDVTLVDAKFAGGGLSERQKELQAALLEAKLPGIEQRTARLVDLPLEKVVQTVNDTMNAILTLKRGRAVEEVWINRDTLTAAIEALPKGTTLASLLAFLLLQPGALLPAQTDREN